MCFMNLQVGFHLCSVNSLFSASAFRLPIIIFSDMEISLSSIQWSISGYFEKFEGMPFCVWNSQVALVVKTFGSSPTTYVKRGHVSLPCPGLHLQVKQRCGRRRGGRGRWERTTLLGFL